MSIEIKKNYYANEEEGNLSNVSQHFGIVISWNMEDEELGSYVQTILAESLSI